MRRGGGLAGAIYFDDAVVWPLLTSAGITPDIGDQLLSACELGALSALNEKGDPDGEPE